MVGQGVSKSDSEMAQKSCVSGAPTRAAQLLRAEAPGTTSTTMPPASGTPFSSTAGGVHPAWNSTSNVGPAMPYTPASPEEMSATFLPWRARSSASMARSSSSVMDLRMISLPSMRSATSLM